MKKLGQMESLFFAYVQMRRMKIVRTGDLVKGLRWTSVQEEKLLSRLKRARLIARVRRGVYLVPARLPLGGTWSPSETLAINTLMAEVGGTYQICGPNAFNRYGLSEQIPNRLYTYNNRLSGMRRIGIVALTLIKVADSRLGDTESVDSPEDGKLVYSSRVRTLVDAVYDWSRFRMLPAAYDWIREELRRKRVAPANLIACALKYGDTSTIRRLGLFLQNAGVDVKLLARLRRRLKPTSAFIPWIPGRAKRGTTIRTWGVVDNSKATTA